MPAKTPIQALVELHRVDSDLGTLKSQRELLPVALRRIETRLYRQRQAIEEKRALLKTCRADSHGKELLLRSAEEETEKLNRQLNLSRNNKEYAALQNEIAAKKADSSRIEDQLLALMSQMEDTERELREIEQSVAQIQREYDEEAKGVETDLKELEGRIAALQATRAATAAAVDEELLAEYERIAAKKGASALAPVVSGTCQGCFMQLPPQFDHLLRSGRKIVHCPSCSRLLYVP